MSGSTQRQLDQLLSRIRDLEDQVSRIRTGNQEQRLGVEAALVSIESDDTVAGVMGEVSDTDDTQPVQDAIATVMELNEDDELVPIQNASRENRLTLKYFNPTLDPPGRREDAGDCFLVIRMRDGRWMRVPSGHLMLRFTLLEDAIGASEASYRCDLFAMGGGVAMRSMARVVDTYGWMSDLQLRAGDRGLCVLAGGKYYFVISDCGSGAACIDGPFLGSLTPTGATEGTAYSWTPSATGTTAESWAALGLPAGLSIDADTGEISGTPTEPGTYLVTLEAAGADDCTATRVIELTVAEAPPP